jgi:RHS repeat-associated protein
MESWSAHYERNSGDPRIGHTLTLEVDAFGNVLKSMAIAYGRRNPDPNLPLQSDIDAQTQPRITATENTYTNGIDDPVIDPDNYRTPSPSETRTYELTGFAPAGNARYFAFAPLPAAAEIPYEAVPDFITTQKRLIQHTRTVYRKNDLTGLLSLHKLESMALPGDVYTMAFTPGLLSGIFGARVSDAMLANDGGYVHTPGDPNWWIPSGQTFYSRGPTDSAAQELAFAQQHFFLPHRFRNALGHDAFMHYDNYSLFIVQTADSAGNKTGAAYDYRALKVARLIDPNGNVTEAVFDMLGMPAGTAGPGDTLNGFAPDPSVADISAFYDLADPHAAAAGLLNGATTRIIYDLERFRRTRDAYPLDPTKWEPVFAATLARETHAAAPLPPQGLRIQIRFSYSDGFGREIQHKAQAEPGTSPGVRWVGSGWTIFNNKGKPIQKFQPFFDDTHKFRFGRKAGVSKTLFYDAPERIVATLHPNHSYEKTVFDPWRQANYDVNDTIKLDPGTDDDVKGFFLIPLTQYLPTWYGQRAGNPAGDLNRAAAEKTLPHADTPEVAHLDALGRPFITFGDDGAHRFATRIDRNIQGHETVFRDERLKSDGSLEQRIVMRYGYDMRGSRIYQNSMDAGERWTLHDVTGKPIYLWNSLGCAFRTQYDSLGRPLRIFVTGADPLQPAQEFLTERFIYGEQHPGATARNLRGKLYLHLDQAGAVINDRYDSKGNLLRILRRLAGEYKQAIGWNAADAAVPANPTTAFDPVVLEAAVAPLLEQETFTGSTAYDALNRPIQLIAPYSNRAGAAAPPVALNVIQPVYNEANLLQRVDVWLEQSAEPAGLLDAALTPASPAGVTNIDYDARGQRTLVAYKNGAVTEWEYDLQTFRLTRLHTRRGTALTSDRLQDLRYTYDPRGNVTHIHDAAQQTIYFNNQQVDPDNDYTYDAMYRLIQASGREHIGQAGGAPSPHSHNDAARTGLPHPGDGDAMARYCENYVYDAIGNILEMSHRRTCPGIPAWTRTYAYNGNRLSSSKVGSSNNAVTDQFGHDAHGNLTTLPHLSGMRWNFKDQLRWTDMGGGGAAWYVYDSAGQRIRKVWEKSAGLIEERIYLGGVELFRRRQGAARFERETLRVAIGHDGKEAMALVETRTQDTAATDTAPRQLTRYQIGNAVGSACIELDRFAQIISYEEYTPYGSTSYQAVRSTTETPKRYRCSGKERDEESGLCYYGARYYAPWLAQWCSCDPDPEMNDLNAYLFMRNNPGFYLDADGRFPVAKGAVDAVRNLGGRKNYSQGTHQSMTIEAYNRSSFRSTEFRKGLVKGVESIDMPEGAVTALGKLIFEGKVLPHQFHDDKTIRDATSPDSKTLESHYGSPHWHSMSATGSTADQTRAAIVDQLEQWYDASEKAKTVSERGEYLGKIAHTLQDSWSKSHVERDASGKILGFQNYDLQDPDVHGSTEHVPQNDPSAVNVTAEMLEAAYAHDKDAFMRVINTNYSMAEGAKADYTAITPIKRNLGDRMRESTDIKDPRFQGIEIDP